MPTFDATRLDADMRERAIRRVVEDVVARANPEVDTLRDVRGRVRNRRGLRPRDCRGALGRRRYCTESRWSDLLDMQFSPVPSRHESVGRFSDR